MHITFYVQWKLIAALYWIFLWYFETCLSKWAFCLNFWSQNVQEYGFSPVCILSCLFKAHFVGWTLSQYLQWWNATFISPVLDNTGICPWPERLTEIYIVTPKVYCLLATFVSYDHVKKPSIIYKEYNTITN